MSEGRQTQHHGEAIVLRTWPFHEADLLVSLFTRDQGKVKGVARHAMKSRRRFGGALEPSTHIRAHYTERPRQDLVRLDSFEIVWSPLTAPIDYLRTAALQLVAEVLEEAMPDNAADDNIFRLATTVLTAMQPAMPPPDSVISTGASLSHREAERRNPCTSQQPVKQQKSDLADFEPPPKPGLPIHAPHSRMSGEPQKPEVPTPAPAQTIWLPITYFALWMNRLQGWMPDLNHCTACGLSLADPALRNQPIYWSPTADGVTCHDDRAPNSRALSAASVHEANRIARHPLADLAEEPWPATRAADLRAFAIAVLERHLERRLRSATALRA
jgi:recombinational DNA repair protein (RecF pathway)